MLPGNGKVWEGGQDPERSRDKQRTEKRGVIGRGQGDGMRRGRGLGESGWFGERREGPPEEGPGREREERS